MANVLNMLKDQIGDDLFSQAGKFLGADSAGVKSAMGAALPSILGSMITSASSSPSGAKGMMDMITSGGHDGSVFDNLGSMFGDKDATSGFMNSGSGILKSLMGNKLGSIVDIISSVSGMKKGLSSSVMSMAAPLVMGMVGKWVKNKALDAIGLGKFLGSQSKHVASALPAGMGSLLGFGKSTNGMGDRVAAAASTTKETVAATASGGSNILSRVLPLLLVLGLGYFGWSYFMKDSTIGDKLADSASAITDKAKDIGGDLKDGAVAIGESVGDAAGKVGEVAGDAIDGAKDVAGKVGEVAGDAWAATTAAAKKALDGVTFASGSVGETFSTWLGSGAEGTDKTFKFKNLNFATSSANITDMAEVNNLANVLKAYSTVNIQVNGHTDSSGNADKNMTLSQQRADAVKNQLVAQGIDASRISTKGYGSTMPTTANGADAANRRVEIMVTKK